MKKVNKKDAEIRLRTFHGQVELNRKLSELNRKLSEQIADYEKALGFYIERNQDQGDKAIDVLRKYKDKT